MKDQWLTGILLLVFIGGGIAGMEKVEEPECQSGNMVKAMIIREDCKEGIQMITGGEDSTKFGQSISYDANF